MAQHYERLKRTTLKDLLEARGQVASNKKKATLIAELMEGDQTSSMANVSQEEAEFQQKVMWRLNLYGPNPPPEMVTQVLEQVSAERRAQQASVNQGDSASLAGSINGGQRRKINYAAFKSFSDGEMEIDAYLQDFERQCALEGLESEQWTTILSSKLTGRAAEAYRAVPDTAIHDYARVKDILLARYAVTPETYRKKFRALRKRGRDSYTEWAFRMYRAAQNWIQGCQATTLEEVLQLFLLEQFFDHTPADTKDWVRDRKPATIEEAAKLADEHYEGRKGEASGNRSLVRSSTPTPGPVTHHRPNAVPPTTPPNFNRRPPLVCHQCNQPGHYKIHCPQRSRGNWERPSPPPPRAAAHHYQHEPLEDHSPESEKWTVLHEVNLAQAEGDNRMHHRQWVTVDGKEAEALRDSGATLTLVQPPTVSAKARTNRTVAVRVAGGAIHKLPTAQVQLNWGTGVKQMEVGIMSDLPAEVLLGNDLGCLTSQLLTPDPAGTCPVTTRAQARRAGQMHSEEPQVGTENPVVCPDPIPFWGTPQDFGQAQQSDPTLAGYRKAVGTPKEGNAQENFHWDKGLLYRVTGGVGSGAAQVIKRQLIVPRKYRAELLKLSHDIPLAGHLGIKKTKDRLTQTFFWPGISKDLQTYCRTCDTCQRIGKRGDHPKAKLRPLPIIEEPFYRVAVDLIGPLNKPSASGRRYILTVVDYATRYPEAVALSNIEAETVAEALVRIFSRVGFPREILSDQGTQFTATVTQQLWQSCGVKPLFSSPYHPQTNGLCERFNGTLKQMLTAFTESCGQWEKFLPHLLFAYREVPQASTGFSPFELLYGRKVRGPLDLIREHWEGNTGEKGIPVLPYVLEFRDHLRALTESVRESLQAAQKRQKQWYDRGARDRNLEVGQKVLALRPSKKDKLQAAWQGLFKVVERISDTTYIVAKCSDERIRRAFHVNMLKPYFERSEDVATICAPSTDDTEGLPLPNLLAANQGSLEQVGLGEKLNLTQQTDAKQLLQEHDGLFSVRPGYTSAAVHRVETQGETPLRQQLYRIPAAVRTSMWKEIQEMLELGVIEPSQSPWASPVVLVPKRDGTIRFCIDYRKLNDRTITDAYPMPRIDELLDRMASGHFLTTLDLCKGYWQIPLDSAAILKSAFVTPFGLYQFRVMPFGMKNAPATFQRMADQLLEGMQDFACAYLDDIAIYSGTWEEHLTHLALVFRRLQEAGLTLKPEKCHVGMAEVQYLGHRVGSGKQRPEPAKVEAIANWPQPRTKTQVLAFLGTAGYYRKFVPEYSTLAKPLTDLTKKSLPKQVAWSPECATAFQGLKTALSEAPVLAAPDPTKTFLVHTDASMFGLGAVLSQVGEDGMEHPVAYLSRKLLPREVSYATVEKECLALVWALKKLQPYLYGRAFTLLTDHNPLIWLNRVSGDNPRLLRWSLALQPYNFTLQYRPGKQNGNADGLSRQTDLEV
ncbi:uncharacterized protein LOC120915831 [Rana temporaria]|uniref:uncharacterized protein LOC120915831 n=1 Tax=Rana temporaria TaxID=8407 RepID=UPI001AAD85CA|nr:uncharacterized protein LOC120915831 [Rana temporaria]